MSVTTYTLGDNSAAIVIAPGSLLADVITAFEAFITSHGWSMHDNTLTNKRVFVAPNIDGSTFKYMMLDFNTSGLIGVIAYETWNNSTHTGTNSVTVYSTFTPVLDLTQKTEYYVFATARWCAFTAKQPNNASIGLSSGSRGIIGVFETARDHPSDTVGAGFPCYAIIHVDMRYSVGSGTFAQGNSGCLVPRTDLGTTITLQMCILSTLYGAAYCEGSAAGTYGSATSPAIPSPVYGPSTVATATPVVVTRGGQYKGRVFGLKQIQDTIGARMSKIVVPVDADFFEQSGGTDHDFFIIEGGLSTYLARWAIPS